MAANIHQIVTEYEERVRRLPHVPALSYGRPMLRDDGAPNKFFLMYLFTDNVMSIEFLQKVGLLRSTTLCNNCHRDMTSVVEEGFRWRCNRRVAGIKCYQYASIRQGSWFEHSKLCWKRALGPIGPSALFLQMMTAPRDAPAVVPPSFSISAHRYRHLLY
jgi:hypothetical protein